MHIHVFWPLFWMAIVVMGMHLRHRRRLEAMKLGLIDRRDRERYVPVADPLSSADRKELEDLRERVKVLERIATDGRSSRELADEIERLRDR